MNHPGGESDMDFHTLSLAFNKRFRNNFFYNVYFDYQWRSEPRSPGTSSTSWAARNPLSADPTAQGWFINYDQDIPTVQDTSTFQFKTSARYVLPLRHWAGRDLPADQRLQLRPDPSAQHLRR